MRRRKFVTLLGAATVVGLPVPLAQQPKIPAIGFVGVADPKIYARPLSAFLKGLAESGYVEGRDVTIEYRWAEGHIDRLPALMADLTHRQLAVIAATSTPAALAA